MPNPTPSRPALLERVASIATTIIAGRASAESNRELEESVLGALIDTELVNLYLPRTLGGLEVDPVTCAEVVQAVAALDTAAAWMLMVANVPRFSAAAWPRGLIDEVWGADRNTIAAISGNNPFIATPCDGGYRVTGQTGFASGCNHARWFVAPVRIAYAVAGTSDARGMLVLPIERCTIVPNWDTLGMRGTGSHDVALADEFVEARRLVTFGASSEARNPYYNGPLYRCARRVVFATYVPISLAVAERALAELEALALIKRPYAADATLAHRAFAQAKYGRALACYRGARVYFLDALRVAFERAQNGDLPTDRERADLYLAAIHAVQSAAEAVRLVCDAAGSSTIHKQHPLERLLRDMEVLRQHGFTAENRYANVAQVHWQAPLDYPPLLQ